MPRAKGMVFSCRSDEEAEHYRSNKIDQSL